MKKKHYRLDPPSKWRKLIRRLLIVVTILLMLAGLYLLLLVLSPEVEQVVPKQKEWNEPVEEVKIEENRLYLPRLQLNLKYKAGDASVLYDHIWHRYPERGDPEKGGNFIVAGHRFEIGFTPAETKRRSPFYHLNKVQVGDYVYADYNHKRYKYQITRKYTVKPTQIEIEAPSEEPKMTLYTCTLGGEADGREVLEARFVQGDVDPSSELEVH